MKHYVDYIRNINLVTGSDVGNIFEPLKKLIQEHQKLQKTETEIHTGTFTDFDKLQKIN
jgi:hypothetical protein